MIQTPRQPTGHDYEDFVVAWLQVLGYFTETRLILKEGSSELLELDVVASPGGRLGGAVLVDAKKGKPGYRDAFTLYGWRSFLEIESACIVHQLPLDLDRSEGFQRLQKETAVFQVSLDPRKPTIMEPFQSCTTLSEDVRRIVASAAWFKQIALRLASAELLHQARSQPGNLPLESAKAYHNAVQDSFFKRTPLGRARALYDAYQSAPRLSGSLVDDLARRRGDGTRSTWNQTFSSSDLAWIQYAMILEHRARMAVLKNAIEHLHSSSSKEAGRKPLPGFSSWLDLLTPQSFRAGLGHLEQIPEPSRVPAFFQQFIEVLGGWYRPGSDDEELVASVTGLAKGEIENYLSLLDHFFPFGGSWLHSMRGLRLIKLVPGVVRGAGCFVREKAFEIESYQSWMPGAVSSLVGWHNSLYNYLKPHLAVGDEEE